MSQQKTQQELALDRFKSFVKKVKTTRSGKKYQITHYEKDVNGNFRAIGKVFDVEIIGPGNNSGKGEIVTAWHLNGISMERLPEGFKYANPFDLVEIINA